MTQIRPWKARRRSHFEPNVFEKCPERAPKMSIKRHYVGDPVNVMRRVAQGWCGLNMCTHTCMYACACVCTGVVELKRTTGGKTRQVKKMAITQRPNGERTFFFDASWFRNLECQCHTRNVKRRLALVGIVFT